MAAIPFWKDKLVTLSTTEASVKYRILVEDPGIVIFEGRAYADGDGNTIVKVNDVCYNWYKAELPSLSQADWAGIFSTHPVYFSLEVWDDVNETWDYWQSFQFNNDWSYDDEFIPEAEESSHPINGRIDARMPIAYTGFALQGDDVIAQVYDKDGFITNEYMGLTIAASPAITDWDTDLQKALRICGEYSVIKDFSNIEDFGYPISKVTIGSLVYTAVTECAKYALYYVNAYGGWDCFLIEGETMESDQSSRLIGERNYNNAVSLNRGRYCYGNDITKTYTLHTGFLSDAESSRMHHLLNSTEVWLLDIPTGRFTPVVMETDLCERKTFRNQGRNLVRYDIVVSSARTTQRR